MHRITRRMAIKSIASAAIAVSIPTPFVAAAESPVIWQGLHVLLRGDDNLAILRKQLPALSAIGVNVLIVEVGYSFDFKSHPKLRDDLSITRDAAAALKSDCRKHDIRLIPEFNCVGHQSWEGTTFPLLKQFPQFDETPGKFPKNKDIYCRSWCPLHPEVNPVVFALIDELIDGFGADAFHVGMDEVFLVASEFCPRCRGKDPAEVFAKAVNDLHKHLSARHVEMLMWGDRLLDSKTTGYSKWEASDNGTAGAIDNIPREIIVCDWHYGKRDDYPTIPLFLKKGFRVWPAAFKEEAATAALIEAEKRHRSDRMLGHLSTTWGECPIDKLVDWPALRLAAKKS